MTPGSSDSPQITVVVADGSPLHAHGAAAALASAPGVAVLGMAANVPATVELIAAELPQVAVIDLDLPGEDARNIVRVLHERAVPTRIIMVTERWLGEDVLECLTAGVAGFVTRRINGDELVAAVRHVASGRSVLPDDVGPALATTLRQQAQGGHSPLSGRERQIVDAMSQGQSAATIAVALDLALPTVKSHISNLYAKLGVHDRGSAVGTAIRRGVIK